MGERDLSDVGLGCNGKGEIVREIIVSYRIMSIASA